MRKRVYIWTCLWALLAGGVAACSDNGEDGPDTPSGGDTVVPGENPESAPDTAVADVSILNLSWREAVLPGEEVRLRANIIRSNHATLQWTVDGEPVSTDTSFVFSRAAEGTYRVKATATNDLGSGSDSLDIRVMDGFSVDDITHWVGQGPNRSMLAVQWVTDDCADLLHPSDDEVFFRAWGYRWAPGEKGAPTGEVHPKS